MSGFTLSSLKNTVDELRSQYYPKNETEKKVYEALSSKNWGASSTLLNEIAANSMDYEKYRIMTNIIWQFLETEGRSWKQVFKTLTLIEFLIKNGSERFIEECRDKLYKIRGLQDFHFYEGTIEKASGIREKSRQIVDLLGSNESIRAERDKARQLRNKFVGIDSRNAGFGGYGGSDSYYGGGGGGGGHDNYGGSSYSGGGGGGRYSDSYDAPNRRASTGSDHHTGRYGGGAYDSDRPPRYGDEHQEDRRSFRDEPREARPNTSRYVDEDPFNEEPPKTAHKSRSIAGPSSGASTGGKLKVSIKKVATPSKPVPAAEKNLLETSDDLIGGPVGEVPASDSFDGFNSAASFDPFSSNNAPNPSHTHTNSAAAFDPFSSNNAPAPTTNTTGFDPFGMSNPTPAAPMPATNAAFDPFSAAPAPAPQPVPVAQNNAFPFGAPAQPAPAMNNFPPANNNFQQPFPAGPAPTMASQFPNNSFTSVPMHAPNTMNNGNFNNQFPPANPPVAPAMNNNNSFATSPTAKAGNMGTFSHDAEFGDFEGPSQTNQPNINSNSNNNSQANKWGDLGKLVDLNKIEKNQDMQAKQAAANNNQNYANSFAGLDGFSKTPQSMSASNAVRPIGSYANTAPMNAMGARPMGGGAAPMPAGYGAPPMGMGMGGPPAMNPAMPPYGAPPMGGGMGGPPMGGPGFGGYPGNPAFPGGAAPMGNPGFGGAPPNPNYMMGGQNPNMYNNSGVPPNYGNAGFGMPPRGW